MIMLNVKHGYIMKITQNLWKFIGFVNSVILNFMTIKENNHVQPERLNKKDSEKSVRQSNLARKNEREVRSVLSASFNKLVSKLVKLTESNSYVGNDPCLLRQTAACNFYQGEYVNLALYKSSLIDLEACSSDTCELMVA